MDVRHLESGVNRTWSRNKGFRSDAKERSAEEFDGASSGVQFCNTCIKTLH